MSFKSNTTLVSNLSKRYRDIFDYFNDLIKEIEEEFDEFTRNFEKQFEEIARESKGKNKPIVYGFRMYIGPEGKPRIEEFGNVRRGGRRIVEITEDEREPLVDVLEKGDEIRVIAELPGVDKDKINVRVVDKTLVIKAEGEDRKYSKTIELPAKVKPQVSKASYKNGVLEVVLKKEEEKKGEEGYSIKVD